MQLYDECLPCLLRQSVEAARMSSKNRMLQQKILDETIHLLSQYRNYANAPELCRDICRQMKSVSGVEDPYAQIKQRDTETALQMVPHIEAYLRSYKFESNSEADNQDFLYWSLKASATGNVLDSAISIEHTLRDRLDAEFRKPFAICNIDIFRDKLQQARQILVIGDNAGETVFDRILLSALHSYKSQLPGSDLSDPLKIIYAVRDMPIINDATIADALAAGLDQYAEVISTGSDMPGIKLDESSEQFLDAFYAADLVVSKGQANFETLSENGRDIFYLLKAKCPVVAGLLAVQLNDFVFKFIAANLAICSS